MAATRNLSLMRFRRRRRCLRRALDYAQRGWPVLPLRGKIPRTLHGFKDATTAEDVIRQWWTQWPDANVGICTGKLSGLVVVDIDWRNGGDLSREQLDDWPNTPEVLTGGGGHAYFRYPAGVSKVRSARIAVARYRRQSRWRLRGGAAFDPSERATV